MHLMELRLVHCTAGPSVMGELLKVISERSYLSTLQLVGMPLADRQAFDSLCDFIRLSKHLRRLDVSHNNFAGRQGVGTNKLLKTIARARNLIDINLSSNNLVNNPPPH